ncbi:Gfo/Idh/MocA family oxidoreductase [Mesomycoplasma hyopneumoniae]|uniref:Gfo/Idh/MocA family oxidoreductase n=1 Tax=Mesomycoplasma hyopneumoniae TaxID=2099 RepID=UPI0015C5DA18|nr:Gfo/Idh/MocA family oxidoreductase [Mesomycoplasma hyopneumoniae]QLG43356.1 Gfo/Idh/MocA family oxidoreductase [Mesomycoplasma hyopneumoniae]
MKKAKIKVGVLGLGRMGLSHAENLLDKIQNAELIALCSLDETAKNYAKLWNIPFWYNSYEKMLENQEIDAVIIVSPTPYHPQNILDALRAKKHVFCEKPLGTNLEEIYNLVKLAKNYQNQVIQIGFMRRYDKDFHYAKQLVDQNQIGKVFYIRTLSQDPEKDIKNMFYFGPTSGGQFIDVGAHDLDLMIWYLNSYPKRVWSLGDAYKYQEFRTWNDGDVVAAMFEFHNGSIGIMTASRIGPQGYQAQAELIGTTGHLNIGLIDAKNNVISLNSAGAVHNYHRNFNSRFKDAYIAELNDFVDKIIEKNYDKTQLEEALVNIIALKKAQESFQDKQIKEINYPDWLEIK